MSSSGPRTKKRVFTLPPSAPFLRTLADRLIDGDLIPGFRYDSADPMALASVTIYVPTRRAARVLRSEFVDRLGGQSAILPVIRPLGETDDDNGYFDAFLPDSDDLLPPLPSISRLLELARLVLAWRNQLPQAIIDMHHGSPIVAPATPADAIWLARGLTELIDSVETEERDWATLDNLDARDHQLWWQLTLTFLKIAVQFWPARLQELRKSSPAKNRNAILRAEAARLRRVADNGPVIVAGSTGSLPATAELIAAVASLPRGAVILPGLDNDMPDEQWKEILKAADDGLFSKDPANRSHPQYGLAHLLHRLGLERDDIMPLADEDDDLRLRRTIISHALTPASATDQWLEFRSKLSQTDLDEAFTDVALIEAANEREEATAIAIALKLALSGSPDSTAALITPDRNFARRVTTELMRFGIEADDSGGTPFFSTQQGSLVQLLLEATLRPGDPVPVVALLKHPLASFGLAKADVIALVSVLEVVALRGGTGDVDISALGPLFEAALEEQVEARHQPKWRCTVSPEIFSQVRDLSERIATAVEPLVGVFIGEGDGLAGLTVELSLADWAERTGRALEMVTADADGNLATLWSEEAGETLATLLTGVINTDGQMMANGPQWIDIIAALGATESIMPKAMGHPRLSIWGTLEARLQSVDTLILAGLNEGTWPGSTSNNPFLSRTMKTDVGLEPPERRIGQLAHDFEMANGTRKLIYSRSVRQGSAPTVASRLLQRLLALGGKSFADRLRERGNAYLAYAAMVDDGPRQASSPRPDPKPGADYVPDRYSFSEVGKLRRDPYSIYAKRILKLDPVDPFNEDPGVKERGTLYHAIVDATIRKEQELKRPLSDVEMETIVDEQFGKIHLPVHIAAVWRPRFGEVGRAFLAWQRDRFPDLVSSHTEVPASLELQAGLKITGIADRIDIRGPNSADIIDYKTGSSPSTKEARILLDPQLALEAAALKGGAFKGIPALLPENLIYVRLRPGAKFKAESVNNEFGKMTAKTVVKTADDLAADSVRELEKLVGVLKSGSKGFISRLMPVKQGDRSGDYDHLARVAEWATADGDEEDSFDE